METQLYLIAHKVRDEPAFDIAHRLQIGDEEGWIIPTSGHRAYPYWFAPFCDLPFIHGNIVEAVLTSMPNDLPDHYETVADKGRGRITGLSALLGIKRPAIEIKRRL